eukprot:381250-Rhodomonas_salina.4
MASNWSLTHMSKLGIALHAYQPAVWQSSVQQHGNRSNPGKHQIAAQQSGEGHLESFSSASFSSFSSFFKPLYCFLGAAWPASARNIAWRTSWSSYPMSCWSGSFRSTSW